MDDVLELRTIKAFAEETAQAAAWHAPGLDRFKVLVSELRLYLEDWKVMLDALEGRLPWHVLHGDTESPARAALVVQLRSGFVAEVVKRSEEIDAALRSAPPSHQQAMKLRVKSQPPAQGPACVFKVDRTTLAIGCAVGLSPWGTGVSRNRAQRTAALRVAGRKMAYAAGPICRADQRANLNSTIARTLVTVTSVAHFRNACARKLASTMRGVLSSSTFAMIDSQ